MLKSSGLPEYLSVPSEWSCCVVISGRASAAPAEFTTSANERVTAMSFLKPTVPTFARLWPIDCNRATSFDIPASVMVSASSMRPPLQSFLDREHVREQCRDQVKKLRADLGV